MRLIDADIFASELDFADADVCEEFPDSYCEFGFSRENIRKLLRDAPTVDAVSVVRCKECKFGTHFGDMEDEWIRCINLHGNPLMPFDGFCSYGEQKEGAD